MSLKDLREELLITAVLVYLFLHAGERWYAAFVLIASYWIIRFGWKNILFLIGILLLYHIPLYNDQIPEIHTGRVTDIGKSWCIVQQKNTRLLLHTEVIPVLDSEISFSCAPERIESSPVTYGTTFRETMNAREVFYSCRISSYETLGDTYSMRGWIQKRISTVVQEDRRSALLRIALGVNDSRLDLSSFLEYSGFSFVGILYGIEYVLKYYMDRDTRKKILVYIQLFLCVMYHFPFTLVHSFLYRLFSYTRLDARNRYGLTLLLLMFFYRHMILSRVFLICVLFRVRYLFFGRDKTTGYFFGLCTQSILFNQMNPVQILLVGILLPLYGFFWFIAVCTLLVPVIPIEKMIYGFDCILQVLNLTSLPGNMLGLGLLLFIVLIYRLRESRKIARMRILLLLVFQFFGLFHPCAEVTFINVGQGDSILIRAPLNLTNILIDTGRRSAWNSLHTYLNAKSVDHLHALILTHEDDDHDGNRDNLLNTLSVSQIIDQHHSLIRIREFTTADLNMMESEDPNQNSLVEYFSLNHKNYLMMADADMDTEKEILSVYDDLKCDVLKVSHHGSKTGTSDALLDQVQPQLAIISSGLHNGYHHPHEVTLQRLLQRHIPYLNTAEEGDITILCLPFINLLYTSTGKISIL
ncbi:MAG: hypothetical protein IKE36_11025 [Solobacterium sp.]|nr:hypothetical protein [Solobacterium sp.]